MKKTTRTFLLVNLTENIQEWLEALDITGMPIISDSTAESMATAAMAVLTAIDDAQATAIEDGYLEVPK